jgi:hypothetical protein
MERHNMNVIAKLEQIGFTFVLTGSEVSYTHNGPRPDATRVRPALEYLRRHREEAICYLQKRATFENEAGALLAECDDSAAWAQRWGDLHDRFGIPCYGFPSWAAWAKAVEGGTGAADLPTCSNPSVGKEHRHFWHSLDGDGIGAVCAICHPPAGSNYVEVLEKTNT